LPSHDKSGESHRRNEVNRGEDVKRQGMEKSQWCNVQRGKVYVPKYNKLRAEIIRLHHDMPVGGHRGQWKTVELVTRNFW